MTREEYIGILETENAELKKYLDAKTKIGIADHKYASKCEDKVIVMEAKHKEFEKYLEDELKRINPEDLHIGELNLRLDDVKFTQYLIYKEVLQKYREIIGEIYDKN